MKLNRIVATLVVAGAVLPSAAQPAPAPTIRFSCRDVMDTVPVSRSGGLGRIEWSQAWLGAVIQRDEGVVAMLVPGDHFYSAPRVVGRYDDGARDSFDGDLAFSSDFKWLFYARQTHQFSNDGIHVLDVSDQENPRLAFYQPQGGTLRIAYFKQGSNEWVFSLDAVTGLVTNRFEPTTGALVPVHTSPLPLLKVGGPSSAGLYVDRKDPMTGGPLLYVSTGTTGVEVFDIADPTQPQLLGSWDEVGLAEIQVHATKTRRTLYAAHEYWFDKQLKPAVVVLDATDLGKIKKTDKWSFGAPADDSSRVQGMALFRGRLYIAHSSEGVLVVDDRGRIEDRIRLPGKAREGSAYPQVGSIAYDIRLDPWGGVYIADASTGLLTRYEEVCRPILPPPTKS